MMAVEGGAVVFSTTLEVGGAVVGMTRGEDDMVSDTRLVWLTR
jgi:hypothetical protein